MEIQLHAQCVEVAVLSLSLSACFENFSGFRSTSFEHNASSAKAGPSHFVCKNTKRFGNFQKKLKKSEFDIKTSNSHFSVHRLSTTP